MAVKQRAALLRGPKGSQKSPFRERLDVTSLYYINKFHLLLSHKLFKALSQVIA